MGNGKIPSSFKQTQVHLNVSLRAYIISSVIIRGKPVFFLNVMTSTAPFLLTVPFFSFKHMSNFYRLINFILDNILHSFSRTRVSIPYFVGPSVGQLVSNWLVPTLLLIVFTSALITKCPNNLFFFHCHCTYAHDHCKRISCLVLFFIPSPLTILLHFFF